MIEIRIHSYLLLTLVPSFFLGFLASINCTLVTERDIRE